MAQQVLGRVVGSMIYSGNGTSNASIASDLTSKGITPLVYDLYFGTSNTQVWQYQLVETTPTWVLLMNIKGEAGPFAISKVYSSVAAMNAGYATDNVPIGGLVVINTGDVDDPDNAKLYVKGSSAYEYLTDMSGAQGIQGPQGETGQTGATGATGAVFTPSVSEAGVISWTNNGGLNNPPSVNIKGPQGETGATGATPTIQASDGANIGTVGTPTVSASTVGTTTTFTFDYLKGEKGDTGANGTNGVTPTIQAANGANVGTVGTPSVTASTSGTTTTFTFDYLKGETGATGADGKTPTLSINSNGELVATFAD